MAKEIEPKLQTIGVYLRKTDIFRIPEYQRAYSWNTTNCDKLWQDVEAYIAQDAEDPYFFGTIIIDCSQDGYLNLIDGQQRTTTFLLLLKAMHLRITEVLSSMADTEEAAGLKRSLQQSLDYIFEILYRADVRKQIEIEKDWNKAKGVKILENVSINELYKNELKISLKLGLSQMQRKLYINFLENKRIISIQISLGTSNLFTRNFIPTKSPIWMCWQMAS